VRQSTAFSDDVKQVQNLAWSSHQPLQARCRVDEQSVIRWRQKPQIMGCAVIFTRTWFINWTNVSILQRGSKVTVCFAWSLTTGRYPLYYGHCTWIVFSSLNHTKKSEVVTRMSIHFLDTIGAIGFKADLARSTVKKATWSQYRTGQTLMGPGS
jgi:hypothetical protein